MITIINKNRDREKEKEKEELLICASEYSGLV